MEGLDAGGDAGRKSGCSAYQNFGSFVFHYFANGFFVSVECEFVTMFADFLYRHKKRLVGSLAVCFARKSMETGDDVGNIVFGNLGTLLVERIAVSIHIIEPYFVSASGSGLCKDKYGGGDA